MDVNSLMQKVRRLAMLDTSVFDEVRADRALTVPAAVVGVVSIFLFAIGGWLWWVISGPGGDAYIDNSDILVKSVIIGTILAVVLWAVWVGITYVLLAQVFRARADLNELVRVMGFAALPLALGILMFIPSLEFAVGLSALTLMVGATYIAVQSATDAPAGRVLVAVVAGFAVWAFVLTLFVTDENIYAPGFFLFDWGPEYLRNF
jgi:hypothetical protein